CGFVPINRKIAKTFSLSYRAILKPWFCSQRYDKSSRQISKKEFDGHGLIRAEKAAAAEMQMAGHL
ncbi:MAG: hypothetical protein ACI3VA_09960, partial [Candidatus Limivicinus sp.]